MAESFARKYRPKSFDEYMGESVKTQIWNRFASEDNFPQVVLLYGPRGTGKTSLARLMAKEYLCLSRVETEHGYHSCGVCEMCELIESGLINGEAGTQVVDGVQEVDVAADGGKANITEVLEDAVIEPNSILKYKIVILDEVHMLSKQLQNALLKLLEEPPKHLVIIMCTTDPDKLLDTLRSRCQVKLEVRKADENDLVQRMLYICKQENIITSKEALAEIAKQTNRVPREALMLLEDVAKSYNNEVTIDTLKRKLGSGASIQLFVDFYKAANKSLESIMLFSSKIKDNDIDIQTFIDGLLKFTLNCVSIQYGIGIDRFPPEYLKTAKDIFNMYSSEDMDALLQVMEYAVKNVDNNEVRSELFLVTTAIRVGKIKIISRGMQEIQQDTMKENKASLAAYSSIIQKESDAQNIINDKPLDASDLIASFGEAVAAVSADASASIQDNLLDQVMANKTIPINPTIQPSLSPESNTTPPDDTISDTDLLAMFNE